ncbi:MAG: protein arginine kinase [Phycisphaerae bacterium]|nr:protein arginine kinase [Phycisphaerae bacterium]
MYNHVAPWMDGSGPMNDIVISSRIRLARNISGFLFFPRADAQQQRDVLNYVHDRLMTTDVGKSMMYLDMENVPVLQRSILVERHLISRRLAEGNGACGVSISQDETLAVMINEEDHLRLQAIAGGLQLEETYSQINRIENVLEEQMEYAFSPRYGYLTACPTNVGTGIRVSVMLHLPALKMTGQIEKVFRAARDMRLAVRGFHGEGTEPIGDFFQLSNQTTLGKSESQIIEELTSLAVIPIVEYERRARQKLIDDRQVALDDKIFRALGTLGNCRMINSEEAMFLLSYVRLGVHLERIKDLSLNTVNEIFLMTQPAHLQNWYKKDMDPTQRDQMRAEFIVKKLSSPSN